MTTSIFIDTAYETYIKKAEGKMKRNILFTDKILNKTGEPSDITGVKISQEMLKAIKELKAKYYTP